MTFRFTPVARLLVVSRHHFSCFSFNLRVELFVMPIISKINLIKNTFQLILFYFFTVTAKNGEHFKAPIFKFALEFI
ncbi:MAG: hypothetical protein DRJ01_14785 [Bacteroidetes bacterium]|nr:MAG: hypothetical protein DRJ01_14785 [Bacteroidota bacterium]